ncbi:MAG: hypothetical protein ACRDNF_03060, partial [Streptosporangiaceae bacterium]
AGKGNNMADQTKARRDAEWALRDIALRYVTATGGTVADRPISPVGNYGSHRAAEPLAGIRAAQVFKHAAARLDHEYLRYARQDGASWDDIGAALGMKFVPETGRTAAEHAYEHAAGEPAQWSDPRSFYYDCGSCAQGVTDHGPYESHPHDRESGHADTCTRMTAEVDAWQAQRDAEDAQWEAGQ